MTAEQQKEVNNFALKVASSMKNIASSHVYFIMQEAYADEYELGHMSWEDCESKFAAVIAALEEIKK